MNLISEIASIRTSASNRVVYGASVDGGVIRLGVRLAVLTARRQVLRGVMPAHAAVVAAFRAPGNAIPLLNSFRSLGITNIGRRADRLKFYDFDISLKSFSFCIFFIC